MTISRVVVLGHTGFIGSRVLERLKRERPDLEALGFSLGQVDMTDPATVGRVGEAVDAQTAVVMCAAIKRQLGDTPEIYLNNTRMLVTLAELLTRRPPGKLVYLSSAAVYGEDIENLSIRETSPLQARSYYGLSKIAGEWILGRVVGEARFGALRPPTIYGPGDLAGAYGPSGFLEAAVAGRPITLWGDGSELREFVFIDDVVRLACDFIFADASGPLNLVSGVSYSFKDVLDAVRLVVGRLPEISSRPRSKDKVDNVFDAAKLKSLFADVRFTPLEEGLRQMLAAGSDAALAQTR